MLTHLIVCLLAGPPQEAIDYLRDIRPVLHQRCVSCHGPIRQEAGLRLDTGDFARSGGDSGPAVVPGKSAESLLVEAITGEADSWRMPPEGEPLTPEQISAIRKWIDRGALSPADEEPAAAPDAHWAFQPIASHEPPAIDWGSNEVDRFIAQKHHEKNLRPVQRADKRTLLRRVYLDLIGLPPTVEQQRAFLEDSSPSAYEKVVDQLLASPQYGERWGRHWMDVWRYSDWYGYRQEVRNSQPNIWQWRDWIIEAVNSDLGYDQMILQMLAADEIAPTDPKQLRATGFLVRNWYKFNRHVWLERTVEHTSKAFLGITMNCAKCHAHKYDPISQEDYYRFRAFFEPHQVRTDRLPGHPDPQAFGLVRVYDDNANTPTYLFIGGDDKKPVKDQPLSAALPGFVPDPEIAIEPVSLPTEAWYPYLNPAIQSELIAEAKAALAKAQDNVRKQQAELDAAKQLLEELKKPKSSETQQEELPLISDSFESPNEQLWEFGEGQWSYENGHLAQKLASGNTMQITSRSDLPRDFIATFRFQTTGGQKWKSVGLSFDWKDGENNKSVYLSAVSGSSKLQYTQKVNGKSIYPPKAAVRTEVALHRPYELTVAIRDQLLNVSVDGKLLLAYTLESPRNDGKFALWTFDATAEFDHIEVRRLSPTHVLANAANGGKVQTVEGAQANVEIQQAKLAAAIAASDAAEAKLISVQETVAADNARYRSTPEIADTQALMQAASAKQRKHRWLQAKANLADLQAQMLALKSAEKKDEKAIGENEKKVKEAEKAVEQASQSLDAVSTEYEPLGPVYPKESSGRRLALAKWIADRDNPLTARVAVNHVWMRHFDTPLVDSVFDFGMNGRQPTHPELLDWLAEQFINSGWSMKWLHRKLVTSLTYQLSSSSSGFESNLEADPDNLYYWRMNGRRMESEIVRDSVLHLAGKLDLTIGGPELDENTALTTHRRSIYYRHAPEKMVEFLDLFNAPSVNECYRRAESIVPQQALAMANNRLGFDQARLLARHLAMQTKEADQAFVDRAFEHILCRKPNDEEAKICTQFLTQQAELLARPDQLARFEGEVTTSIKPAEDPHERARENLVHVLLNHNDFITVR